MRSNMKTSIKGVPFDDRTPFIVALKIVYPELAYYLDNDVSINSANLTQFHFDYFEEYKWLKATDSITGTFVDKVQKIAQQKGESVFMLTPRNQLVTEMYDDHTMILFVDGMGIEYYRSNSAVTIVGHIVGWLKYSLAF